MLLYLALLYVRWPPVKHGGTFVDWRRVKGGRKVVLHCPFIEMKGSPSPLYYIVQHSYS